MLATIDHERDLGIYFVATPERHRGQGLASRLLGGGARRGARPRPRDFVAPVLGQGRAGVHAPRLRDPLPAASVRAARIGFPACRPAYSDEQLDAAIEALTAPERFREAEALVAEAAPKLQRVLLAALEQGGWFAESHDEATAKAVGAEGEAERLAAVRTLLAEETRMGMLVGVAVGWALANELTKTKGDERCNIKFHGHACFELSDGSATLLIDPFLKPNNPARCTPPTRSSRLTCC